MKNYTFIRVCPTTKEELSWLDVSSTDGLCPRCGNQSDGSFAHHRKVVGEYSHVSTWDYLIRGKKPVFTPKNPRDLE